MAETTRNFGARIPNRELVQVAWRADMLTSTAADISRYAIYRYLGYSHDDAKKIALANRTPATQREDTDQTTVIALPVDIVQALQQKAPELTNSEIYRYALNRITMPEDQALREAKRKMGRPRKTTKDTERL